MAALKRMGHAAVTRLPEIPADVRKRSVADIFAPQLIAGTVIVTLAYFFHITTFYFVLKWTPNIVADMGFPASSAAGVLVWANVGGACGGAALETPFTPGSGIDQNPFVAPALAEKFDVNTIHPAYKCAH